MIEFILGAAAGAIGMLLYKGQDVNRARVEADREYENEGDARRRHIAKGWREMPDGSMVSPARAAKMGIADCGRGRR